MYINGFVCAFIVKRNPKGALYAWGIRGTDNGTNSTSREHFTLLRDAVTAGKENAKALNLPWRGFLPKFNQE
jgi:hypothetical protein